MAILSDLLSDLTSGDDSRAEAAVRQLSELGIQAIPELKRLLTHPQPDVRWWAVWALAGIDDPEVPSLLVDSLQDSDGQVRQCAALALRQQPDPRAIPHLIGSLESEDRLLAHLASAALIAIGAEAVPALLEVMENGPQASRLEAVQALALIGDHRSIPALFQALNEGSALMEYWGNEGLERMGVGMAYFKPD